MTRGLSRWSCAELCTRWLRCNGKISTDYSMCQDCNVSIGIMAGWGILLTWWCILLLQESLQCFKERVHKVVHWFTFLHHKHCKSEIKSFSNKFAKTMQTTLHSGLPLEDLQCSWWQGCKRTVNLLVSFLITTSHRRPSCSGTSSRFKNVLCFKMISVQSHTHV